MGARHLAAEVRDPLRRRVRPHAGGRRALRLRVVFRRLPLDGPGRGSRPLPRHQGRREGRLFPARTFDMWNVALLHPADLAQRLARRLPRLCLDAAGDREDLPGKRKFQGPGGDKAVRNGSSSDDFQVFRNLREHPRAWVVHALRRLAGRRGDEARHRAAEDDAGDHLRRTIRSGAIRPARSSTSTSVAWVGPRTQCLEPSYASGRSTRGLGSRSRSAIPAPSVVELDVNLESPGVVVLADVYYPGWELTIDGMPAPIYRINRMMRGAAVRRAIIAWSSPTRRDRSGRA